MSARTNTVKVSLSDQELARLFDDRPDAERVAADDWLLDCPNDLGDHTAHEVISRGARSGRP